MYCFVAPKLSFALVLVFYAPTKARASFETYSYVPQILCMSLILCLFVCVNSDLIHSHLLSSSNNCGINVTKSSLRNDEIEKCKLSNETFHLLYLMESLFGLCGKDFVLVAADNGRAQSIILMKSDVDKITDLGNNKAILVADDGSGDGTQFTELVARNTALYTLRHGYPLTTHALAHYVRRTLADKLRKAPLMANSLVVGFDEDAGGSLYWVDYLASIQQLNFAAHGYASNFIYSIFDRYWHSEITIEEGKEIIQRCITEIQKRFLINNPSFTIKLVTREGVVPVSLS
ncbi:hypothetical protein P9112_007073 [Eukaryota sp. TZLM1-RC]